MLIYLIGYMASGKTTTGRQIADELGLAFADMDALLEAAEDRTISQIFSEKGEAYFRRAEQQVLYNSFATNDVLFACGGGLPCFADNMDRMNAAGLTVWIDTDPADIYQRLLQDRSNRPLLAGIADARLAQHIQRQMQERLPFYSQAHIHYHPQTETVTALCQRITAAVHK